MQPERSPLITPETGKQIALARSYAVRRPGAGQEPEPWRLAQARRELGIMVPKAGLAKSYAVRRDAPAKPKPGSQYGP